MNDLDPIIKALARRSAESPTLIVCVSTGPAGPKCCTPMPRAPTPPVGIPFADDFGAVLEVAIKDNPSVHDGAVLVVRSSPEEPYLIGGWSYRLFPPPVGQPAEVNKGSAFNSCHAMSFVAGVDAVYLVSGDLAVRFRGGRTTTL